MDADWYVDPQGRFDGRYFDGQAWTNHVSAGGDFVIDPDWPPAVTPADAVPEWPEGTEPVHGPDPESTKTSRVADHVSDLGGSDAPVSPDVEVPDVEVTGVEVTGVEVPDVEVTGVEVPDVEVTGVEVTAPVGEQPVFGAPGAVLPAVEPLAGPDTRRANLTTESPARTVAVLGDTTSAVPTRTPAIDEPRKRRWPRMLAALLVVGCIVLGALWLFGRSSSDSADAVDVDLPEGIAAEGTTFDPSEEMQVGLLRIVNGTSLLADLEDWHAGFAAARGVNLAESASCWLGRLGDAAVQTAFCGPVGVDGEENLYDKVPLIFADANEPENGLIAQPVVDAASIDSRLAKSLELIGAVEAPAG